MKNKIALVAAAIAAAASMSANAALTIGIGSASGAGTVSVPVTLARPVGDTNSIFSASFRYNFTNPPLTNVTFSTVGSTAPANSTTTCNFVGGNALLCGLTTNPGTAIAVGNYVLGTATFTLAAAPTGPQTVTTTVIECTDGVGNKIPGACVPSNGVITVTAPPTATLTYNPAAGTAVTPGTGPTFTGATNAQTASITITPSGLTGAQTAVVSGCAIAGTGAAAFGAVTTTPANGTFTNTNTPGSINLACTRAATAQSAVLTCQETIAPAAAVARVWNLTCPAGPAVVVNYTVPPATLTFASTAPGANLSQNVPVAAAALNTAPLQLSQCTIAGANAADFSVTAPVGATTVAAGTTTNVVVRFAPTGLTPATRVATLTCPTPNATAPNTASFTVALSGAVTQAIAVVAPATPAGAVNFGQFNAGQVATRTFTFNNSGNAAGDVTCALTNAAGYTLSPAGVLSVPAAGSASYTVTLNTGAAGTFGGTLTCTGATLGGSPVVYTLTGTVVAPPVVTNIPTMTEMGKFLMIALMLGFGVVVVGTRQRG